MSDQPIQGSIGACMAHYFAASWNTDPRSALASLAGCVLKTVREWARTGNVPRGENLLRTAHYLAMLGYDVSELRAVDPDLRDLGRMITLNIFSIDAAAQALGYTSGKPMNRRTRVYGVLLGGAGMSAERVVLAQQLHASHKQRLAREEDAFGERCPKLRTALSRQRKILTREQSASPAQRALAKVVPDDSVSDASESDTAQIAAALAKLLYLHVRNLRMGPEAELDAFREAAPGIGHLGQLLLLIDAQRK